MLMPFGKKGRSGSSSYLNTIPPCAFGSVKPRIGAAVEGAKVSAALKCGHADADGKRAVAAGRAETQLGNGFADSLGPMAGVGPTGSGQKNPELLTANAAHKRLRTTD